MLVGYIVAIFMLGPKGFTKVGERFVYGKVAPAFGGHIIAKPLVKKLVHNSAAAIVIIGIQQFAMGGLHINAVKRSRCIFHSTTYIITNHNLRVFIPGVIYPQ